MAKSGHTLHPVICRSDTHELGVVVVACGGHREKSVSCENENIFSCVAARRCVEPRNASNYSGTLPPRVVGPLLPLIEPYARGGEQEVPFSIVIKNHDLVFSAFSIFK